MPGGDEDQGVHQGESLSLPSTHGKLPSHAEHTAKLQVRVCTHPCACSMKPLFQIFFHLFVHVLLKAFPMLCWKVSKQNLKWYSPTSSSTMLCSLFCSIIRYYNEFLMAHHRDTAHEIRTDYVDTMGKIYFSYFKSYYSRLMKLQVRNLIMPVHVGLYVCTYCNVVHEYCTTGNIIIRSLLRVTSSVHLY